MLSRSAIISFYGSKNRGRGIHPVMRASSTFHVCLLCMLLVSFQIHSVQGELGRIRHSFDAFPLQYREWVKSVGPSTAQKREPQTSGWDLADDLGTLESGEDFNDINDAVLSSEKTSLTREEIQRYLAQMKAYYLKNGMPRYG
ncbi:conserved hypothetical protein [Echinococcus multilocularis]|uniref:Uncharacterized protein n=1 Tax=Echinococcus multilocularis TaxID=6211 RepID=A0A068Y4V2_ECHMU|nr:conserved hypothetical protein [Echinococcus multilocularis]